MYIVFNQGDLLTNTSKKKCAQLRDDVIPSHICPGLSREAIASIIVIVYEQDQRNEPTDFHVIRTINGIDHTVFSKDYRMTDDDQNVKMYISMPFTELAYYSLLIDYVKTNIRSLRRLATVCL